LDDVPKLYCNILILQPRSWLYSLHDCRMLNLDMYKHCSCSGIYDVALVDSTTRKIRAMLYYYISKD